MTVVDLAHLSWWTAEYRCVEVNYKMSRLSPVFDQSGQRYIPGQTGIRNDLR